MSEQKSPRLKPDHSLPRPIRSSSLQQEFNRFNLPLIPGGRHWRLPATLLTAAVMAVACGGGGGGGGSSSGASPLTVIGQSVVVTTGTVF